MRTRSRRIATKLRGYMEDAAQEKILRLLDVISVEVAANRNETAELRTEIRHEAGAFRKEMRTGFQQVDRRLGNLETRVENLEAEVQTVKVDLRLFRGEFDRRIAPLER